MRKLIRSAASALLLASVALQVLPCGPSYVTPVFEYESAPENPYENFAAGRIGIVKSKMHRSVLLAAYRYVNGGGFNAEEQKGLVDVWNAEFNNRDYNKDSVSEAIKAWVQTRLSVVGKDAPVPDIYAERPDGEYDFFPNCSQNAFEVATETLNSRKVSYGSDSKDVLNWIDGQDTVFSNCSKGRSIPAGDDALPDWLKKDRAYQIAAAEFYSLDYANARTHFEEIAADSESPWQETSSYLVLRTLVRQASLAKSPAASAKLYADAEERLNRFVSGSGKFTDSADKMLALVKYRNHPQERLRELARQFQFPGGDLNFRQNLIDFTWLMDKFESQAVAEEAKRNEKESGSTDNSNSSNENSSGGGSFANSANSSLSGNRNNPKVVVKVMTTL